MSWLGQIRVNEKSNQRVASVLAYLAHGRKTMGSNLIKRKLVVAIDFKSVAVSVSLICLGSSALAQEAPSLNLYGVTGLIDMPSAESAPDGQLTGTTSSFAGQTRNTLTFQISPRLSGSFRYSILAGWSPPTIWNGYTFDRSFDVRYQLAFEGRYRPALAVGFQDFMGTGLYSGEYLVATKHLSPKLKFTGGVGWGRLGSLGSFSSGFGTRNQGVGLGGVPGFGAWFKGPMAAFGGVEWQTPIEKLILKAEYSSDAYRAETTARSIFTRRSSLNVAAVYRLNNQVTLSGYYLYGSELGISAHFGLNPRKPAHAGSLAKAPMPVLVRPDDLGPYDTGWTDQPDGPEILKRNLQIRLKPDGLILETLVVSAQAVEIRFRNVQQDAAPQAIGRVARALSWVMPRSVERFVIIPVVNGMATNAITLSRSDIEALEHAPEGAEEILRRARFADAQSLTAGALRAEDLYPKLTWALTPYIEEGLMDPDNPLRLDFGARLAASYEARPGLVFSGSISKKLFGNLSQSRRLGGGKLPVVQSDFALYHKNAGPAIEYLTVEYFFRPAQNLYGRVTAGYLGRAFGGISSEVLWKRVNSNFALGAELNFVRKRDYNQLLGFQSYSVPTGHVSAYLDMNNGYSAQMDFGKYLARDVGATFGVDRRFDNGWKAGAYFTLTNVSFADFGEGSFDKGIRFTMPLSWITGKATRDDGFSRTVRPVTRDGGARLNVRNRLFELVSEYQGDRLKRRWGRFWR